MSFQRAGLSRHGNLHDKLLRRCTGRISLFSVGHTVSILLLTVWLLRFGAALLTERWWFLSLSYPVTFARLASLSVGLWLFSSGVTGLGLWVAWHRGFGRLAAHTNRSLVRWVKPLRTVVVVFGALLIGPVLGAKWKELAMALYGWDVDVSGPAFLGQLPQFYMFRLPILYALTHWVTLLSGVCFVVVLGGSIAAGRLAQSSSGALAGEVGVVKELSLFLFLFASSLGALLWLRRFVVVINVDGLSATQESVGDPGLALLGSAAVLVGATALSLLVPGRLPEGEPFLLRSYVNVPIIGSLVWIVVAGLLLYVMPVVLDPSAAESRSLSRTEAIRLGYGLQNVGISPMQESSERPSIDQMPAARPNKQAGVSPNDSLFGNTRSGLKRVTAQAASSLGPRRATLQAGSLFRRTIMSAHIGNRRLMTEFNRSDHVAWRRSIQERATALAPFLAFDSEPYQLNIEGRTIWVLDAYTVSRAPGSVTYGSEANLNEGAELTQGFSYVRGNVRVLMDSTTGRIVLVQTESDPVTNVWGSVFPGLFASVEEAERDFPDVLRALRYPKDFFQLQVIAAVDVLQSEGSNVTPASSWRGVSQTKVNTGAPRNGLVQTLELNDSEHGWVTHAQVVGRVDTSGVQKFRVESFLGEGVPLSATILERLRAPLFSIDSKSSLDSKSETAPNNARSAELSIGELQILRWNGKPLFVVVAHRGQKLVGVSFSDGRLFASGKSVSEGWNAFSSAVDSSGGFGLNDRESRLREAQAALQDAERRLEAAELLLENLLEANQVAKD